MLSANSSTPSSTSSSSSALPHSLLVRLVAKLDGRWQASLPMGGRRRGGGGGGGRTARSLPSIIFYRASTYRQPRTHDRVHAHARATGIINHYYLGVIFLRYNFVCLPPRVGARGLCTPRTRGRESSVSKSGAVLLSLSLLLLEFFFIVSALCPPSAFPSSLPPSSSSSVYFFTVRELSTSTFMCTHACSFVSLKLDVFPTPMTVKSGLFFLPRERSSFRGSRSTKASARNASIESRESSSTLKLYYTSSEQIVRFDRFFFVLLYFD